MTALAKTRNAEVSAMAHAAHSFSRMSVRSRQDADNPAFLERHRARHLSEVARYRKMANDYLAWARREKAWSLAQAAEVMAEAKRETV